MEEKPLDRAIIQAGQPSRVPPVRNVREDLYLLERRPEQVFDYLAQHDVLDEDLEVGELPVARGYSCQEPFAVCRLASHRHIWQAYLADADDTSVSDASVDDLWLVDFGDPIPWSPLGRLSRVD